MNYTTAVLCRGVAIEYGSAVTHKVRSSYGDFGSAIVHREVSVRTVGLQFQAERELYLATSVELYTDCITAVLHREGVSLRTVQLQSISPQKDVGAVRHSVSRMALPFMLSVGHPGLGSPKVQQFVAGGVWTPTNNIVIIIKIFIACQQQLTQHASLQLCTW